MRPWICTTLGLAALSTLLWATACTGDIGQGAPDDPDDTSVTGDDTSVSGDDTSLTGDADGDTSTTNPGDTVIGADTGQPPGDMTGDMDTVDPPPPMPTVDPNTLDQAALFTCSAGALPTSSPARIRRVERRELVGITGHPNSSSLSRNPFDAPLGAAYSTYSDGVTIDAATLDLYLGTIEQPGRAWTERDAGGLRQRRIYEDSSIRCMFNDAAPDAACIDHYLTSLLEDGVFFRPPTPAELDQLRAFTEGVLAEEATTGAPRTDSLRRVTSAAWMMSGALFRTELGEDVGDPDGRLRLTDHELANALALALTDHAPGTTGLFRYQAGPPEYGGSWSAPYEGYLADIEAAAHDGTIQDPAVIGSLLRQYGGGVDDMRYDLTVNHDERRRHGRGAWWTAEKLTRFFREWLDYGDVALVFKDTPAATSQFNDPDLWNVGAVNSSWGNLLSGYYGHESTIDQQLDDMIARIVVEDQDVLRTLLTTRRFFLASTTRTATTSYARSTTDTQRPYGVLVDVPDTPEGRWVTLPTDERAGVLTHPAWLAAHGGNFEDDASVVHRGKWVRENLLCQTVPPLELVMVEAQLVPSDPAKSARQRIGESIENNSECTWCHQLMNPLGYPFEIYNHAGFLRADDHGSAPDGSSTLANMPDPALDGPVRDAVELSERLADSQHVQRCFTRQVFRYFMGRDETMADACTLVAMESAYEASDGSLMAMVEALVTSDTFVYRHVAPDPEPMP